MLKTLRNGKTVTIKKVDDKPRCLGDYTAYDVDKVPPPQGVIVYCISQYGVGRLDVIRPGDIAWYPLPRKPR